MTSMENEACVDEASRNEGIENTKEDMDTKKDMEEKEKSEQTFCQLLSDLKIQADLFENRVLDVAKEKMAVTSDLDHLYTSVMDSEEASVMSDADKADVAANVQAIKRRLDALHVSTTTGTTPSTTSTSTTSTKSPTATTSTTSSSIEVAMSSLDALEARSQALRSAVTQLTSDKRLLQDTLTDVSLIQDVSEEKVRNLREKLEETQIDLRVVRDEHQEEAIVRVRSLVSGLAERLQRGEQQEGSKLMEKYINSCNNEDESVADKDDKFEALLLSCAIDDQKEIKKELRLLKQVVLASDIE